jgi:hypothetical protein
MVPNSTKRPGMDQNSLMIVYSKPFCTIWDQFRTFWTILGSVQTFLSHFSIFWTILDRFGSCQTVSCHFRPFQAYFGFWTHLGEKGYFGSFRDHFRPLQTFLGHFGPFETIPNHSRTLSLPANLSHIGSF